MRDSEMAAVLFILAVPVAHQLADSISGVIGLRETVTVKHQGLRVVWLVIFCLGVAATIYFLYATTAEYLDEPTVTKVGNS